MSIIISLQNQGPIIIITHMNNPWDNEEINEHHHTFHYEWDGERIDTYLVRVHGYTRNFFHRLIARGDIVVNGKVLTKKSLILKTGDTIEITHPERYMEASVLATSPEVDLPIILEKKDYVVIRKKAGILSHPNSVWWVEHASVVGALYHRYKEIPSMGNFIRAWLLHRLDKETDGLMIVAKTEEWLAYFKKLFQKKTLAHSIEEKEKVPLKKCYRAQVYVTKEWEKFLESITLPHIISQVVKPKVPYYEPKLGITKITSCELGVINDKKVADIEIELLTWRTHQIRYHLSQLGLPIVWDYLYGTDEWVPMHLQAYRLAFTDNEGEEIDLSIDKRR